MARAVVEGSVASDSSSTFDSTRAASLAVDSTWTALVDSTTWTALAAVDSASDSSSTLDSSRAVTIVVVEGSVARAVDSASAVSSFDSARAESLAVDCTLVDSSVAMRRSATGSHDSDTFRK